MSKIVVYILDKAVWLLLATVITAQALQMAGLMRTPKSAGAVEYQQNTIKSLRQQLSSQDSYYRWKRDTSDTSGGDRSQFIDMLFNRNKQPKRSGWTKTIGNAMFFFKLMYKIPIKTLTAVNNLIQHSRPVFRKMREFVTKRLERTTKAPEADTSSIQKRSYPVYIRPVGGERL